MHHLMSRGKYERLPEPQVREMAISFKIVICCDENMSLSGKT
jgi:hypothetical protein